MPTRKLWNYIIELKKGFVLRKKKVYSLSREKREEIHVFVEDQLQKGYIQPSKSLQTLLVYFVAKKDGKRKMVQNYYYCHKLHLDHNSRNT